MITDSECRVFLPDTSNLNELAYLGVKIMSSDDWYTPSMPGLSIYASRTLLTRIIGKSLKFARICQQEPASTDNLYIYGILYDSLSVWYSSLPKECWRCLAVVSDQSAQIDNPNLLWITLDAIIQFYFAKYLVISPLFYHNILKGKRNISNHRNYIDTLAACEQISNILSLYLLLNPEFNLCSPLFANYIFQFTLPLICAMKLDDVEKQNVQKQFSTIRSVIATLTEIQQREPVAVQFLDYLISLPSASLVIENYRRYVKYDSNPFFLFLPNQFDPSDHSINLQV